MGDDTNLNLPEPSGLPSFDDLERGTFTNYAQRSRVKELKSAKWILIAVGSLLIVIHSALFVFAKNLVETNFEKEVKALESQGLQIDPDKLVELKESDLRARRVLIVGMIALGVLFCGLGFGVAKYPVFCTATGLVIYVGIQAISACLDWTSIFTGILVKVLIIVALASAVQTALAYERQLKKARDAEVPA